MSTTEIADYKFVVKEGEPSRAGAGQLEPMKKNCKLFKKDYQHNEIEKRHVL